MARSGPLLVFLDVNILFSAALGGPAFEALRALAQNGTIRLTTSEACVIEAETNLARKRPARQEALASVLATITVQGDVEADEHVEWAEGLIHQDDVHVLAAARRASADVLLTGDTTHFAQLMQRNDLGMTIRTPRDFLLEGPPPR